VDPQAWGLGKRPAHEFVVREATARRQVLHRISKGEASPAEPLQPVIWADTTDGQRSGLRALENRWQSRAAAAGSASLALGKRTRTPPPTRYGRARHGPLQPHGGTAVIPRRGMQPPSAQPQGPPSDEVDVAVAAGPAAPWAHVWRVIHTSHMDRQQRVTAWRLLHGKLFVGGFMRHIRRTDPAEYSCPHSDCAGQNATLTHVFITCPLAARVLNWFAATWSAITGETAPPRSADLLRADDTRAWGPPRQLRSLWHRLRLATICQLRTAYQRARHQPSLEHMLMSYRMPILSIIDSRAELMIANS
jgi:hypothetical protein